VIDKALYIPILFGLFMYGFGSLLLMGIVPFPHEFDVGDNVRLFAFTYFVSIPGFLLGTGLWVQYYESRGVRNDC